MHFRGFWRHLSLMLILMAFLIQNATPVLAAFRISLPLPTRPDQRHTSRHTESCQCKRCPGEPTCCCELSHDPLTTVVLLAACDQSDELRTTQSRIPGILPTVCAFPPLYLQTELEPATHTTAPSRFLPDTLLPPPRLLYV